jgi:hypothetical protein
VSGSIALSLLYGLTQPGTRFNPFASATGLASTSISSTGALGITSLFGQPAAAAAGFDTDPLGQLTLAETNQAKDVAQTAQQPDVQREIAAFRSAVAAAKAPADLLANPAALKALLTASGLGDQAAYTALATKTLLSNVNDSNSLANQLSDTRWKPVVQTYDFANKGLSVISQPRVVDTISNGYAEIVWRQSLDQMTPGLSNALSFRDKAAAVTSADQILGDPTLRAVVTTALGIPAEIAFQDLPAQEQAITSHLDIAKLQDPKFVEGMAQRYLLAEQASITGAGTITTDMTMLAAKASRLFV